MEIRPLTAGLGAEILGADIRSAADFKSIFEAFVHHSVIVIRDQQISPDDHIAFARQFGPININRFFKPAEGYPEIATVSKEPDQKEADARAGILNIPMMISRLWALYCMQ